MATETTVKFLLLLIALAIIVFLLYRYVVQSPLSERECATRMTAWCVQCEIANRDKDIWSGGPAMGESLSKCVSKFWWSVDKDQECGGFKENCEKGFLP